MYDDARLRGEPTAALARDEQEPSNIGRDKRPGNDRLRAQLLHGPVEGKFLLVRALELGAARRRKRQSDLLCSLSIVCTQTDDFCPLTFQACQLDFKLYEATRRHDIANLLKLYSDDLLRRKPEIPMFLAD